MYQFIVKHNFLTQNVFVLQKYEHEFMDQI